MPEIVFEVSKDYSDIKCFLIPFTYITACLLQKKTKDFLQIFVLWNIAIYTTLGKEFIAISFECLWSYSHLLFFFSSCLRYSWNIVSNFFRKNTWRAVLSITHWYDNRRDLEVGAWDFWSPYSYSKAIEVILFAFRLLSFDVDINMSHKDFKSKIYFTII